MAFFGGGLDFGNLENEISSRVENWELLTSVLKPKKKKPSPFTHFFLDLVVTLSI